MQYSEFFSVFPNIGSSFLYIFSFKNLVLRLYWFYIRINRTFAGQIYNCKRLCQLTLKTKEK